MVVTERKTKDERRVEILDAALTVFADLGHDDPITVAYRRRLATALY